MNFLPRVEKRYPLQSPSGHFNFGKAGGYGWKLSNQSSIYFFQSSVLALSKHEYLSVSMNISSAPSLSDSLCLSIFSGYVPTIKAFCQLPSRILTCSSRLFLISKTFCCNFFGLLYFAKADTFPYLIYVYYQIICSCHIVYPC